MRTLHTSKNHLAMLQMNLIVAMAIIAFLICRASHYTIVPRVLNWREWFTYIPLTIEMTTRTKGILVVKVTMIRP